MATSLGLLLVLTAILAIIYIVQAQDQDQRGMSYLICSVYIYPSYFHKYACFFCLTNSFTNVLVLTSALV